MRLHQLAFWRRSTPSRLTAGTFLGLIAFGALGLHTIPALYVDRVPLGWIDALFTATSAICVTGLIVVDTATHFTRLGQAYLLLLIQLGGLGIITLTSLLILGLGGRLSVRTESVTTSMVPSMSAVAPGLDTSRLVRDVVLFTVGFELLGALLLFASFAPHFPLGEAAWHAFFHAVSAFCNAGFSTFSDSLIGWQQHAPVLVIVMALIVIGGLGFLTLEEVTQRWRARRSPDRLRLSLHSKLVFAATGAAIAVGAVLFTIFEWRGVFADLPPFARVLGGVFMSVTARTAGFNAIDYAQASDASNFLTILLMTVGGAPGSTAGGLKITTVVVIGLVAWARMRGATSVSVWARTIPEETVQRAIGVAVFAFTVVAIAIFLLTTTETQEAPGVGFLREVFEVVSAFNTVGLSLGSIGHLETGSRVVLTVLMFIGRVGPLAFAAALAMRARGRQQSFSYAREDVSIG